MAPGTRPQPSGRSLENKSGICRVAEEGRNVREPARVKVRLPIFEIIMRSALLWLIGIPIPIILVLWLVTGHA